MATSIETFTSGTETAVDVAQVERQLRDLWKLASKDSHQRITRACLFNLVAYVETDADRDRVTGIISEVTSRHPCRAMVLLAKTAGPDEIGASITAHCHLAGGGGKQVCCEQISIHAAGNCVADLPGAVLPLLESDLPTVLWWHGNFLERLDLFRRLRNVSDRLIYDTSTWPAVNLPQLAGERPGTDLSWTRLALWQQLIAEAFDEPHCASALPRLREIEISYGCGSGAELRAQLLGSWVAAQLGWSVAETKARLQLSCREGSVGLLAITLRGPDFEVRVHKNHGEQTASVVVNVPDACGLPRKRAFEPDDEAALLGQELDRATAPAVYARALAMASLTFAPSAE
ncbi:MAG: glucose-6-phosphate dehydrogenase assembly protein OpcA [Verrucomicrobiota bacterium]